MVSAKKISALVISAAAFLGCGETGSTVVIISANSEWRAFLKIIGIEKNEESQVTPSPYGGRIKRNVNGKPVIFFHGGWGKTDAAGSAQYVIDKFQPARIVNIGTAGGFHGKTEKGDVILANRVLMYDIHEQMGDSREAIDYYATELTPPELTGEADVKIAHIVSADADLAPEKIPFLASEYGACCADWESASIAHVAKKNNVPCIIMRGISDVVYPQGSETYGSPETFHRAAEDVMRRLLLLLEKVI